MQVGCLLEIIWFMFRIVLLVDPAIDTVVMKESSEIIVDVINTIDNICNGDRLGEFTFSASEEILHILIYIADNQNTLYSTSGNTISDLPSSDYSVWVVDESNCHSRHFGFCKIWERLVNTDNNFLLLI